MKRDMDLYRAILMAIEVEYKPGEGVLLHLEIPGYDMETIAEHCDLLHQEGLLNDYKPTQTMAGLMGFRVGNMTYKGYDFLEKIRDDKEWERLKAEAEKEKLPKTLETFTRIAGIFMGNIFKEISGQ